MPADARLLFFVWDVVLNLDDASRLTSSTPFKLYRTFNDASFVSMRGILPLVTAKSRLEKGKSWARLPLLESCQY